MSAGAGVVGRLRWQLHRLALEVYRRLPVRARRAAVRAIGPTYTAGAIAVVERDDGAVLLIRQSYRRNWGLPGGLLAKGEPPAAAVVREVREELGVDIVVRGRGAVVLDVVPRRFDFVYRARLLEPAAGEALRPASPEVEAAAWFPRDALPELQFESRVALEAIDSPEGQVPHVVGASTASLWLDS